jgi:phospholipid/cholesterol/gamma-HCH transport system substrate-binding protein
MRSPHSFANRTFLIGGLILFASGLFFIAKRQNLFTRNFEVYTEFDRLNGLPTGAKVRVSGMDAGEVLEAQVPNQPEGRFRLRLRIKQKFRVLVRGDSVATIRTTGLGGSSFLDIQKGTQRSPEVSYGGTIAGEEPFDLGDLIQQGGDFLRNVQTSVSALQAGAQRTLDSIELAAKHSDRTVLSLGPELQKLVSTARQTSDEVAGMIAQVEQGQGTLGKLLRDPTLADLVDQTARNASQSAINLNHASAQLDITAAEFQRRDLLGRAQAVLENTRQLTETLNQAAAKLKTNGLVDEKTAADLRDAIGNARITMSNLADDTEALKHNFLLRGFFKKRGYFDLNRMTPAQYYKVLQENPSQRIWLTKSELFAAGPDGNEKLTKIGEARVDGAMNVATPYLPGDPIVVEGYSTQPSRVERVIRAKQRAVAVQTYITNRFGLTSNTVAVMPMPDLLSVKSKSGWDGVCLVLIR